MLYLFEEYFLCKIIFCYCIQVTNDLRNLVYYSEISFVFFYGISSILLLEERVYDINSLDHMILYFYNIVFIILFMNVLY